MKLVIEASDLSLSEETTNHLDLNLVRSKARQIAQLKGRLPNEGLFLKNSVLSKLREEYNSYATMVFKVKVDTVLGTYWEVFPSYPTTNELKNFMNYAAIRFLKGK